MTRSIYDWQGPTPEVTVDGTSFRLPLYYHENHLFASVHAAAHDAVAAELPSDLIEPARWLDGRALVVVHAFRYAAVSAVTTDGSTRRLAPYGEVIVSAAVTRGPAPRALPILGRQRGFVLQMPVTSKEARDGGSQLWGYPKFVADMDFAEEERVRAVQVSEAGARVLTLTVRPGGRILRDRRPLVSCTSLHGQLLETLVPAAGHVQIRLGGGAGHLDLGRHPVAERLRRLDISPEPLAVYSYLHHRSALPAGVPLGPARAYAAHAGEEREFGRYTVSYPGTAPLDQYAPLQAGQRAGVGA
jgi:hypothetical protein